MTITKPVPGKLYRLKRSDYFLSSSKKVRKLKSGTILLFLEMTKGFHKEHVFLSPTGEKVKSILLEELDDLSLWLEEANLS